MSSEKVKVKTLKSPLWQDLVYLALIMVAPIVITCIELFHSNSLFFKISFASVGAVLTLYIIIKRYVLRHRIDKLKQTITLLEHDYSINSGDETYTVAKWKSCQLKLYLYNAITVLLSLVLTWLFVSALSDGLIEFGGAVTLILLFVFVGMVFKVCTYIRGVYVETEDENSSEEGN